MHNRLILRFNANNCKRRIILRHTRKLVVLGRQSGYIAIRSGGLQETILDGLLHFRTLLNRKFEVRHGVARFPVNKTCHICQQRLLHVINVGKLIYIRIPGKANTIACLELHFGDRPVDFSNFPRAIKPSESIFRLDLCFVITGIRLRNTVAFHDFDILTQFKALLRLASVRKRFCDDKVTLNRIAALLYCEICNWSIFGRRIAIIRTQHCFA